VGIRCAVDGRTLSSSRKQVVCESTLLSQVCDQLDEAGKSGLTVVELARQLGFHRLDARLLLRNLCRKGLAVCTLHDKGKGGIHRYALYAMVVLSVVVIIDIFIHTTNLSLCVCTVHSAFLSSINSFKSCTFLQKLFTELQNYALFLLVTMKQFNHSSILPPV